MLQGTIICEDAPTAVTLSLSAAEPSCSDVEYRSCIDSTGRKLDAKTVCNASRENAVTTHHTSLTNQRTLGSFLLEPVAVWPPRVEAVAVLLACKSQTKLECMQRKHIILQPCRLIINTRIKENFRENDGQIQCESCVCRVPSQTSLAGAPDDAAALFTGALPPPVCPKQPRQMHGRRFSCLLS